MTSSIILTILVVDDDHAIRHMMRELLDDEGYSVQTATDGRDALTVLLATPDRFGLILLDLNMPNMNGWQFRHEQRRHPLLAHIPVVVFSACANLLDTGLPEGVQPEDCLPKPFRAAQLFTLVDRFVRPASPA